MTFKNKEIHCTDCGTQFGFSAEEQSFYAQKGLDHEPRRCKQCRTARRGKNQGRRQGQTHSPGAARQASPPQTTPSGHQSRNGSSQRGGGPFVRHSRQNSHGSASRTPWVCEDREPRRAGIWQPRHGKSQPTDAPLFKAHFGPSPRDRSLQGDRQGRPGARTGNSRQVRQGSRTGDSGQDRRDAKPLVLHDAICSACKTATQVPFKPNGFSPVYCRTCLPKHKEQKSRPQKPVPGSQVHRQG